MTVKRNQVVQVVSGEGLGMGQGTQFVYVYPVCASVICFADLEGAEFLVATWRNFTNSEQ